MDSRKFVVCRAHHVRKSTGTNIQRQSMALEANIVASFPVECFSSPDKRMKNIYLKKLRFPSRAT